MVAAAKVWGQRYVFIYADIAGEGLLPVQAESMGKIVVTTEMGGAGQCSSSVLRITERGVRNVMIHLGLTKGDLDPPLSEVTVVASTDREDYHLSPANGIYESFLEVGQSVKKGEPLGQVHFPERHDYSPEVLIAQSTGILI